MSGKISFGLLVSVSCLCFAGEANAIRFLACDAVRVATALGYPPQLDRGQRVAEHHRVTGDDWLASAAAGQLGGRPVERIGVRSSEPDAFKRLPDEYETLPKTWL